MPPIYVTKNLATGSSTGLGTFSSAGTVTLLTSITLATGRRIIVWGSSALGASVVLTGLSETGTPLSETVATSTTPATAVESIQDFTALTAVTVSCAQASTTAYIGTSSRGGTPWTVVDTTRNPINLSFLLDITSPSTVVIASFEYAMDYPSYNPQTQLWNGATSPTRGPVPTISSLGSSVTADTAGAITSPISAWRITLTSSSSGAGSVGATVIQSG